MIDRGSPGYDDARRIWNGTIDRRPAAVVRAAGVGDVVATVRAAHESGVLLAVRAGGHSMPGFSACDGGIVLDLSAMHGVRVDPDARIAEVDAGTLLGELDEATMAHGLATPTGTVSHTGVAGLTLGGGMGRLMRKHGATVDNLVAVDLVTAEGTIVRAGAEENPDLFWGMRGAGANFGVVTRFEFRLHPLDATTYAAMAIHPIEHAAAAIRFFREYGPAAPDEVLSIAAIQTLAHGGPFPPELAGRRAVVLAASYCGSDQATAERVTEPLRRHGSPLFEMFVPAPYLFFQKMMDEAFVPHRRYYVKGAYFDALPDDAIGRMLASFELAPGPGAEIGLIAIGGGAFSRIPEHATALTGRATSFYGSVELAWDDPAEDETQMDWGRATMRALEPYTGRGAYINALDTGAVDAVRAAYGDEKYERLVGLKTVWDPDNVFRLNQNIPPKR